MIPTVSVLSLRPPRLELWQLLTLSLPPLNDTIFPGSAGRAQVDFGYSTVVTSIFLYASESSWTLAAELQRRIQAMEMRCYRKILRISYKDHVTNEEVRAKIQQAIGPHEDLLTITKRHKLQWHGHVFRSSGLAKIILQGTLKGERRQGRQRKRWENNIREWTGLEFGKLLRAVESRGKWRKVVAKSSVVPQLPSRLRD